MQSNNYNIENFEKPEDKQKGRIGAGIFVAAVLFFLIYPWFKTTFPVPEAEGLMASFGNVEVAGGSEDFVKPEEPVEPEEAVEEPVEEPVEDPIEDPIEEVVETVENTDAPVVEEKLVESKPEVKTESKPESKPKVNQSALFSGSGKSNGKGSGTGDGIQGTPDGKEDLGGTGEGEKGRGRGKIGIRRNIGRCEEYQRTHAQEWSEKGRAVVFICINSRGKVIETEFRRRKSTIIDDNLIKAALGCAEEYTYEKAPGAQEACGEITIQFGLK